MDRIEVMELVRSYQVGTMSRREFLIKATTAIGSLAGANMLLIACASTESEEPPPVVDESQPAAVPGTETDGELTTGIVSYAGLQGEELMGYIAYQANEGARPAIIVLQEWWGLNDHIKEVAQRFAREGFVALAPDLYHGVVTTEPDEARKLAMELGMGDAVGEIQQAIAYLKTQDFVGQDVGIVGFCMGGGLVLQTAANDKVSSSDEAVGAGVVFYGRPLSEADAEKVTAPILTFLGTEDRIPVSDVEAMHAVFENSGLENSYQIYEGAEHAFFNDTRTSYNEEAAADAWAQTLAWFRKHLSSSL